MITTSTALIILAGLGVVAFIVHERIFGPKGKGLVDQLIELRIRLWQNKD